MTAELAIGALQMGWHSRSPGNDASLIFHSDRDSQYASVAFSLTLGSHRIRPSMSRKGNCWDRDPVRIAQGGTAARHGVPHPQRGQGRHARMAALVPQFEGAFHPRLPQPNSVRAASNRSTGRPRSLTARINRNTTKVQNQYAYEGRAPGARSMPVALRGKNAVAHWETIANYAIGT